VVQGGGVTGRIGDNVFGASISIGMVGGLLESSGACVDSKFESLICLFVAAASVLSSRITCVGILEK
jgi:hypothetical protein